MRKRIWMPLLALALGAGLFFGPLPAYVEGSMNRIDGQPLPAIRPEVARLHASLSIVDLHSDTLMWRRSVNDRATRGHMDVPRLAGGNVALQVFSSVTKTPKGQNYDANSADGDNITLLTIAQLQPIRTWTSLTERALWHAAKRDRAVAASNGQLLPADSAAQIDALLAARTSSSVGVERGRDMNGSEGRIKPIGAMLSIEGLHNLEGKLANLDKLYAAGFRMAGLTHFFDNELAGSMHGEVKGGLTPFGRRVVRRMEDLGMIVDIAHLSPKGVAEVLAMARRPVVSSHGGVQATCKVNRNLSDDQIRGVAATGGLIAIGYWEGAVCDTSPAAIAKAMKHVRDLVGVQHVALGSDYDGAVTVRFDTAGLAQVTQALVDAGFSAAEIRAVMGENAIRVLRAGVMPMAENPPPLGGAAARRADGGGGRP
jgi:microsomal dipeptidase-like Zn-dependent dipeptidase